MKKSVLQFNASLARRTFLKRSVANSTALLGLSSLPVSAWLSGCTSMPLQDPGFVPDIELLISASADEIALLDGPESPLWKFSGEVLHGPKESLSHFENSYLGPTIRVQRQQKLRIVFQNKLPEPSIIHWHGLHLAEQNDGHPSYAIDPGQTYVYEFEVTQRAGTYWYHPHPHGRTGFQIYHGLAGLFIVEDPEEAQLGLPSGEFDLAFCIQDRRANAENQIVYLSRGGHDRMMGMLGNRIFINGKYRATQSIGPAAYRIRLQNASNARIYNLAWSDGAPLTIIATDGGLLETPVQRPFVLLSPGERIELWRDFSSYPQGHQVDLMSQPIVQGRGKPFRVVPFAVTKNVSNTLTLPARLSNTARLDPTQAANTQSPKLFSLHGERGKGWTLDGRTYEMRNVTAKETVRLGTMEIWEFETQQEMMAMPHPIHIHGSQFQILSRTGSGLSNHLDLGWKDTVLIMPGEKVQLIKRFDEFPGYFVYHCHNLEHEDMGMMRDFRIL